jgi:hypothetical protein
MPGTRGYLATGHRACVAPRRVPHERPCHRPGSAAHREQESESESESALPTPLAGGPTSERERERARASEREGERERVRERERASERDRQREREREGGGGGGGERERERERGREGGREGEYKERRGWRRRGSIVKLARERLQPRRRRVSTQWLQCYVRMRVPNNAVL